VHSLLSLVAYRIPEEKYPAHVFNDWQDMALCFPARPRAPNVLKNVGGYAEEMRRYLAAAEKAYERAVFKPFYSEHGRRVQNDPRLPLVSTWVYSLEKSITSKIRRRSREEQES
jgi:hypothetical protein